MDKLYELRMAGLILTAAIGTSAVVLFSGIQYGPSSFCQNVVNDERKQWKEACRNRNSQNIENSVFQEIEQRRVDKSDKNGCNPNLERWYCVIDHQLGEYKEFFETRPGK